MTLAYFILHTPPKDLVARQSGGRLVADPIPHVVGKDGRCFPLHMVIEFKSAQVAGTEASAASRSRIKTEAKPVSTPILPVG